jgi:hypothetical protein
MIDIAPRASSAYRYRARSRVNSRVFYRREVNDDAVITNSQAPRVMSAASDGKKQIVFSRKIYRLDYICCIRAAGDQARPFVYHSVVHFAGFIISLIARLYQSASKVCS